MKKYDYVVVGSGLFGATFANLAKKQGKKVLVIEKRSNIAGNIYTEEIDGIQVHKYGAHIFHTDYKDVWEYVNSFVEFNRYTNSPIARIGNEVYNMPFNMNTFSKIWNDVVTPEDAIHYINEERKEMDGKVPSNLEEQAISLVGRTIYEKLIKGYTEKQWNRPCSELPAFIIKRLPVRLTYDNNYFNDRYQGIPVGGYTQIAEKLLADIPIRLETEYKAFLAETEDTFEKVLYTGMIDEFFDYCYGQLEYRSLRFESEYLPDEDNFQGNAVVNYTERKIPYTRIIEHKHFEFGKGEGTVITREYPAAFTRGDEPYYPVNDEKNGQLYQKYAALAKEQGNILFGGRLGQYKYYDMDKVIRAALDMAAAEIER